MRPDVHEAAAAAIARAEPGCDTFPRCATISTIGCACRRDANAVIAVVERRSRWWHRFTRRAVEVPLPESDVVIVPPSGEVQFDPPFALDPGDELMLTATATDGKMLYGKTRVARIRRPETIKPAGG